jgi:hypothetical protein
VQRKFEHAPVQAEALRVRFLRQALGAALNETCFDDGAVRRTRRPDVEVARRLSREQRLERASCEEEA